MRVFVSVREQGYVFVFVFGTFNSIRAIETKGGTSERKRDRERERKRERERERERKRLRERKREKEIERERERDLKLFVYVLRTIYSVCTIEI